MLYLTLVRHGETRGNAEQIIQSRTGGELTELGFAMAQALGRSLQDEVFTRIYSSDLNRCQQTTKGIVSQIKDQVPEVQYTAQLRERDYGDWEFMPGKVIRDKMVLEGLPDHKRHHVEVPNGETYEETVARAGLFFSEICKIIDEAEDGQAENILAVSHGIFKMCFMDYLLGNSDLELKNVTVDQFNKVPPNTARTRFSVSKLKAGDNNNVKRCITFTHVYCAEHLKDVQLDERKH
ncbi:unnamed protein product [Allacma fusca]|uniref:Fructose-2,6-bisphosphatase TIGAR n=1 Tax=Allacma fusca TaxID=39272 RepID=A0A8J2JLG1_9HEXA|nr:unnamed protein product [Allacma fusca]